MPSPLDALKFMFQNPGEAAGMAGDMLTRTYPSPLPQAQIPYGNAPIANPFFPGATVQGAYDTARDMTQINPALEAIMALTGYGGGKMLGAAAKTGPGRAVMGHVQPYIDDAMRGIRGGAPPMGGFADNAAGTIRGDVPPAARFGDDFRAMGALDDVGPAPNPYMPEGGVNERYLPYMPEGGVHPLGPDDFPHPDAYNQYLDQMQAGPQYMDDMKYAAADDDMYNMWNDVGPGSNFPNGANGNPYGPQYLDETAQPGMMDAYEEDLFSSAQGGGAWEPKYSQQDPMFNQVLNAYQPYQSAVPQPGDLWRGVTPTSSMNHVLDETLSPEIYDIAMEEAMQMGIDPGSPEFLEYMRLQFGDLLLPYSHAR